MTENKKLSSHIAIVSVSLILVFSLLFTNIGSVLATTVENASKYISEVQVFSGDSLNEAVKKCESAGYIAVKKNINRSEDGDDEDNGIFIVGYKTTDDPDEGITDISLLQMNSGYQDYTYGDVAERAMEKLGNVPTELSYAVSEFADNYSSGSPAAIAAVKILNCYHVDELDNIKLGDYMVSGDCNIDFVKKILSRSNTSVVSAFCNALVGGVADYGDENWAARVSSSQVKDELADSDNDKKLDIQYKVLANELVDSLQTFAENFNAAAERYSASNGKLETVDSDETETEMSEETVEDMTTGGEVNSSDGDAYFLYAYDVMNQYNYDETTKLGDYIVSLGNSSYDEISNLRKIYPLVDSLTDGQVAAMRLCGVASSAIYLVNGSGLIDEAEKQVKVIKDEIKSQLGTDSMSVWIGTDQTIYNQKVAVTTEAYRANSAGQIYNTLTSPDDVDTFLSEAYSKINIASLVIGFAWGITYLATTAVNAFAFTAVFTGTLSMWATCCVGIGSGALGTIFGILGCAAIVLNYVALAAMVVILVALLVKYLWDLFTDDDSESFTPIPSVIFDVANNRYVRYDAVNQDRSPANINGDNARRWNALYTTKSQHAGNPIQSSEIDDLITVQYNDNATPQGYEPVKCFGEVSAANLNANSKSDSCAVYMFCKTTSNVINDGESAETKTDGTASENDGQYISKLKLSVESTETAAKAGLTKSGYKVLDVNLTPVTDEYTYLGYTTTTNADDAVTDIRISARNSSDAYLFGNASYTACGTTPTGDTLYYTSYKTAGTPILADLLVKYSLDDIPEGYEPVNMFCGGNAFNLNVGSEVDNKVFTAHRAQTLDHWNDKGVYLYFKPSVTYTDGEEYISGIVLVAGNDNNSLGNTADDYIKDLKLKKFDLSLTHAARIKLPDETTGYQQIERWEENIETYICYTTTHNPYRAIYGIRSYTSAPGSYSVPVYLGTATSGSYAVCDVMFSLPHAAYEYTKSTKDESYRRGIYETHSYLGASVSGSMTGIEQLSMKTELTPEDYEDVSWSSCSVRGKGIYVLGPVEGGTPLTVNDILVSSDSETPEGFASVQDFKTPNRTESHNLGYNTNNSKYIMKGESLTPVYIYLKQETATQKKYISSICVSTYTLSSVAGDKLSDYDDKTKQQINASGSDYCIQNLLSKCTDEIIQANIALDTSQTFYGNPKATPSTVSYIGVSRTDSQAKAITGIIRYVTDKSDAPATITVSGVSYTKAGDMIPDPNGSYYLYYTTSAGASPGMPITDISVSSDVFETDCATAMSTNSVDAADGTKATLYGDSNESAYIHMSYVDTATMMGAIYIGHGKTQKEAQANLLSLGCNICVDMDVNRNTGGEYIYIGYSRYTLRTSEIKKGVAKYAVRDIILTVGQPHQSSITVNGVTYVSARDEYTTAAGSDGTKAVSLNSGTGGKQIYLYYTTQSTKETAYPIAKLGLACRDYGMINDDSNVWEHVFDVNGNRVNLNEGAIATVDDGEHITDNRVYLYASRTDNAVKESCKVDMNALNREFVAYDVYMKGA
jgi:hypothetical protein